MTRTYNLLWAFEVHPEHAEAFRRYYGEGGEWTQLFRRARGYLGTRLLQDEENPSRFVTIDTWSSAEEYEAFRASFAADYAALDRRCERFTLRETLIGRFTGSPDAERA